MNELFLECEQVSFEFQEGKRRLKILDKLDCQVKHNECIAITGPSGSGKSTLLQLMGGLDKPTSGVIRIAGKDVHHLSETQLSILRNQQLGFVYQFHHLLPEFTAIENVAMPLLIRGLNKVEAQDKAENFLRQVSLGDRLTHRPTELSGGERQRTAIARALVGEPACVLADEPTGNLDQKTAHDIIDLILELNETMKTSFVIVTHDLNLANKLDRHLILEAGRLSQRLFV